MTSQANESTASALTAQWSLPSVATLGSSVRALGIQRELRRRMPIAARKSVTVGGAVVVLTMAAAEANAFDTASNRIAEVLETIARTPVLPTEVEDILSISARERHKWLKDGRLKSVGTRTVKMRGRAKSVTFHVFDPTQIGEVLNRDLPALWREEDEMAAADNRRRAAGKAALNRRDKNRSEAGQARIADTPEQQPQLDGWDAFEAEGLLR